ncbi:DUF1707 and DUF4190 domain-containing protein [Streptomyces griseorubiginosus]|uniref:DUF1707 and DUF4190 domain-containing protein n=1 Tax=Streptomyces griseorubiginosus TaxID=67304 RepID=UPI003D9E0AB6
MSQPSWQSWQDKDEWPSGPGRDAPADVPAARPWTDARGPVARPWPGYAAPHPGTSAYPGASAMLASHADRERAVDVLRAGYGEGRLEKGEFDKRVERAYAARTVGELALLVSDLPLGPVPQPAPFTAVPRTFLPTPRPRANGKAVGAAVCGLLCVPTVGFTGIPAVILGHAARAEMERTGESGDGLALIGLVLGWLSVAAWSVLVTLMVAVGLASG